MKENVGRREPYILVEDMAMDGPVESVFEGSAVEDPNPLLLSCPTSCVRRRRHCIHLSLSLSGLFLYFSRPVHLQELAFVGEVQIDDDVFISPQTHRRPLYFVSLFF